MKKILILSVCILFIFISCKKRTDVVPVNTITAVVNGATLNFNVNVTGGTVLEALGANNTTLNINGLTASDNTAAIIGISVTPQDGSRPAKGTYTFNSTNAHPTVYPYIVYNSLDNNPSQQPFYTDPTGKQSTTVTITSISSTNVQGTFSGILVHSNGDGTIRTVANGKFNVNISN